MLERTACSQQYIPFWDIPKWVSDSARSSCCAPLKSLHSVRAERLRKLLREARTAAGITQLELASKLRRPQSFVSKFEQGERRLDVIEYVELCEALGISAGDLLGSLQRR